MRLAVYSAVGAPSPARQPVPKLREALLAAPAIRGHTSLVRTVQATRNKIVSGSYDETVRVWRRDTETGDWMAGPVLRQAQSPIPTLPSVPISNPLDAANHAQLQLAALQQFQANSMGAPVGVVQMHQVQQVGSHGMAGAVAAAQLLPSPHQQAQMHAQMQQMQTQQHLQSLQQHAQAAQAAAQAAVQAASTASTPSAPPTGSGAHRVFKLQFDARWIICCSQDTRIVGWDYAADDDGVIEASRFFVGGN